MTKKTFKPWMGLIFVILSKWQKARSMQKLESFKNDSWTRFFGVCRFVGLSQDEDELADEYDVAINHDTFKHVHKIETIQARAQVKGRRISRLAEALDEAKRQKWKAKKKDGVIRPFLWLRTKVGGGLGFPHLAQKDICNVSISAPLDSLRE